MYSVSNLYKNRECDLKSRGVHCLQKINNVEIFCRLKSQLLLFNEIVEGRERRYETYFIRRSTVAIPRTTEECARTTTTTDVHCTTTILFIDQK